MGRLGVLSGLLVPIVLVHGASAQESCEPVVGSVASLEGSVEVERAGTFVWQPANLGQVLCEGDSVRVGPRSRAALRLVNDAVLRLDQNTTLQLTEIRAEPEERSFLQLVAGVLQSFSRSPRRLAINTPYLNATIEGTEFVLAAADRQGSVTVLEGIVTASNEQGEVRLASGEAATAAAGQAPQQQLVVRPRDAVQWALYYPSILAAQGGQADGADLPPTLAAAMARADEGDLEDAFALLEGVPEGERDAQYEVYRAGLLLSVGRVEEAQAAIDRALARDPGWGPAYAQRAIIELVGNQDEAALASAQHAVELSPEAAAPKIALSYAQQASFELEAARDTLRRAVEQQPNDALAWARLSELWLMLGERRRARDAAERAVALAPEVERTQITLGFADLVEFRTGRAKEAFERAIALAPADPLPRLGLGLAQIREGDLEEGRQNLEIAVGLSSNDSLLRSYLGKAYFEEQRGPLDGQQFAIAKELDPLDPTPWLYDAIRKQTANRPGEALEDLQTSIELNDNRAVYRSRQLLDSDRAARGTSLARIHNDLGFAELGVTEATRSLTLDPTNASAHRFLSDSYRGVRRREIARVSELLQAQMLQDINVSPVQPSLSEANVDRVTQGPAEAGFNEFTPLFERRQAQVNATGLVGNENTYGGEGVVSMLYDRYSISAGAFGYQSDGWRDNNDIKHDIQNVFFQTAITPELNAQVEVRRRHSEQGDLAFNFDPDNFSPNLNREFDTQTYRAGMRYSPGPSSDFLLSVIYSNFKEEDLDDFEIPPGTLGIDFDLEDHGYQVEGQYLHRWERMNLTIGSAYYDRSQDVEFLQDLNGDPLIDISESNNATVVHPYAYATVNFPDPVAWTFGLSYDDFEQDPVSEEKLNPKLGVQWNVTDDLLLRGAFAQFVKPVLASNQTLEPTQVAGFNQVFDDTDGAVSKLWGVGLDWSASDRLFFGAETTWRDLDVPAVSASAGAVQFDFDEQSHRLYVNWLPIPQVALRAEFVYDRFQTPASALTLQTDVPEKVETFSVPLGIRYFHPSGAFAGFGVTYVNQDVERTPGNELGLADGHDDFLYLDASVGYRLPKRLGIVSVGVTNLLDQGFQYQDDSFREFQDRPSIGPYFPERLIFGRITLNW